MYFYCICGKEGDLRVLLFRHLAPITLFDKWPLEKKFKEIWPLQKLNLISVLPQHVEQRGRSGLNMSLRLCPLFRLKNDLKRRLMTEIKILYITDGCVNCYIHLVKQFGIIFKGSASLYPMTQQLYSWNLKNLLSLM